jgi:pimeloyl-ACP methyl ester carboxylesterase
MPIVSDGAAPSMRVASHQRRWLPPAALAFAAALTVAGCGMMALKRNVDVARELASVDGHAEIERGASEPIVVVVADPSADRVAELFLLARPGPFFLTLPAGRYRLGAFADLNRDLTYQPGSEPATLLGTTGELVLDHGEHLRDVILTIDPDARVVLPFGVSAVSTQNHLQQIPSLQIGTVADLDDPRFAPEHGKLGVWDPLRFMFEVGGGVYFLEPYDPARIPILFVHGATGTPADWRVLAGRIDRRRFQPWFAYYPSAAHLDRIGDQIVRALSSLQIKYGFTRLVLVAHSMGGLVTRSALNYVVANPGRGRLVSVPLFVSISSPWGGYPAASLGVEYSPIVAPMWEDMAPGSAFLSALPKTPLPPETEYALFFSYRSDSVLSKQANDGTITVASELPIPMQRQAQHVMGFDETHVGILGSAELAERLNEMLARVAQ